MAIISRLLSVLIRVGEIAFAAVVAGTIGSYLHQLSGVHGWDQGRWIYVEVIAGLSILLGLLWLLPFAHTFFVWPLEIIISLAWFAAFGLLVNGIDNLACGSIWSWGNITDDTDCGRWKAAEAFSFLSAILWFVSGLLGLWFVWRMDRATNRRFYGRYNV
jgi:hypothetical protein